GSSQPDSVTAHDFNDRDHARIIDSGVFINLSARGGDILGGTGKTRAVVRAKQIVVNGLGNAHHAAIPTGLGHKTADFVACIHGVIAAIIEEITDVVLFEDF